MTGSKPKRKTISSAVMSGVLLHLEKNILVLRDQKVMLDETLAKLYGIETKALIQAVKRNAERFPDDFMFQLVNQEVASMRSQSVTSSTQATDSQRKSQRHTLPYAFTEQGVAMLSSVLNSPRAVTVNIEIMRIFVRVRALATSHGEFAKRLGELEQQTQALSAKHDGFSRDTRHHLKQVFDVLRELMEPPPTPPKRPMGFVTRRGSGTKNARLTKPRASENRK
jgi:ORF6N domain